MILPTNNPLLEKLPWAIITLNIELKVVDSNAAAREMFNLNAGEKTVFMQDLVWIDQSGKTLPLENHPVSQSFKTGEKISGIVMGFSLPSEKQINWIVAHCIPEFEEGNPKPVQVVFTFSKTTQQQPLKSVIDANDLNSNPAADVRRIFESDVLNRIGQAVIITDLKGNISYVNEAASKIYGWKREEFSERNVLDITVPETSCYQASQIMKKLAKGDSWSGEFEAKRKDGTIFTAFVTDTPLYNEQGELSGIIGISSDITEQKAQKEALQHGEMLLKETGKIAKVGGWELDCSTMQQIWTDETYVIHDREKGVYNPNSTEELSRFETGSRELIEQAFNAALTKGKPYDLEVEMTTIKGNRKWVRAVCSPVLTNGIVSKLKGTLQDITERKLAQEKLRESEQKYRTLFTSMDQGFCVIEKIPPVNGLPIDFRYVEANPAFENHTGIPNVVGKTIRQMIPGADEAILDIYDKVAQTGQHNKFETYVASLNSWIGAEVVPAEKPNQVAVLFSNITERKQAEIVLRESETRFATLFKLNPSPVGITSAPDFRIVDVNEAWCRLTGYAREEVIGLTTTELALTNSDTLAMIRETLMECKKVFPFEITLVTRSGQERQVVMSSEQIELAGKAFFINTLSDITEIKQADKNKSIALTKYKALFDNFPLGITVSDKNGNIIETNATAEKILGISAEEQKQRQLSGEEWKIIRPDGTRMKTEEYASVRALNLGEKVENLEMGILKPDDSVIWLNVSAAPIPLVDYGVVVTYHDITERKKADEQLARLAERLNLATHSARIGIWDWNVQKNELMWDEQMFVLYGLQPGEFKGAYEAWLNGVHPDDREDSNRFTESALRGEREYNTEFRVLWPDESVHWLKADGMVFRDENGKAVRMIGVNYDITERKQAEKNLKRWADAFENVAFGFVIGEPDNGNLGLMNPAFARMHGYTVNELTGVPITRVFAPEYRIDLANQIKIAYEKGHNVWESKHIRKDGTIFPVLINVVAVKDQDGKVLYRIVSVQDITEREKAEEQLRKNQALLRQVLDNEPDSIFAIDLNCQLLFNNRKHQQVLVETGGHALQVGESIFPTDYHPEVLSFWKGLYNRAFIGEEFKLDMEWPYNDGKLHTMENYFSPLKDPDGIITGALVVIHDITEQKLAEQKLRDSEKRYTTLFRESNIPVVLMKLPEVHIADVNKAVEVLTGFSREELIGKNSAELGIISHSQRTETINKFEEKGSITRNLMRITTKSGDERIINVNTNPVEISGEHYAFTSIHDITERVTAENKLRESEERYRKLAENFPDTTITFYNSELKVTFVTGKELHKTGNKAEDFIGKRFDEILIPSLAEVAEKSFKKAFNGEINNFEAKSYGDRYIKVISVPVYDASGAVHEIQVISQNITESKKAEQERLISEQKYTLLFENSGTPSLVFKMPGGVISEVNRKVEKLTGYSREELIGKNSVQAGIVMPEYRAKVIEILSRNEILNDFELLVKAKNGEIKTVLVNAVHFNIDENRYIITTWFDITDRKKAEEQLRASEARFKAVFEYAPVGISLIDKNRTLLETNNMLAKIVQMDNADLAAGHYKARRYMREDGSDLPVHEMASARVITEKRPVRNVVNGIELENGETIWTQVSAAPLGPDDPRFVVITQDITDLKNAVDSLVENEQRLRKTIETTSDGFWIVDSQRRFVEVNEAYCNMSGYTKQELYLMSISDVEAVESSDDTDDRILKISKEGSDRFETRHWRKNGTIFDVEVSVNILDLEKGLMICFCRDITERKEAEKQIRESEKRFATIFEDSPVAIAISRMKDGKIIMANSSIIDLLGYNYDELIGNTTAELGIWIYPKKRQLFIDLIRKEKRVEGMETVFRLKSGEKRQVMIWGELIDLAGESCMMAEVIDITERKEAEKQLYEREAELNNAMNLAKMASWRVDLSDYRLTVSKNYGKMIELEDDKTDITFDYFLSRMHPDDVKMMNPGRFSILPDSPPIIFDFRMLMPDGTVKWFQNTMVGEFSEGSLVALKGTNIDITEKKNQEEEIRSQNQKLNAILNALPDRLFVHDSEGNYLEAYTTDPSGFIASMDNFIGKNIRDVLPKDVAETNLKYLQECLEKKKILLHELSFDYKGTYSHFEVRVVPLMEDKVIRFVRDITERKEIEKQINKLNKAIEQSPVAIIITDPYANITYASSAIEEMTGYQKNELMGKNIGILKSRKNKKGLYKEIWEKIQSGENWDGELINKKKNGKLYWTHMSITPLFEKENQITGYLAVKQDITEKKKNEQEILELNTNLERKVEERTLELKRINEELVKIKEAAEEANKAKSIFLANMSHEIRTPLNSIIGFSELLFNSSIDEKKRSQVISIRNSGRSLLNIINDILDLSKVEAGKIVIEREPLNVFKIVSDVGSMFEQKAAEKKLSLTIESETDLITPLLLDETRLRQILFNLVGNAIKFTSNGGVSVVIRHQEKEEDCVDLGITVADTGIGIPQNQLEAIFEPFVQQQGQVQKTFGGTGLGLAISRRMAEAMGGEIRVKSVPDIGSEFTVCLKNVAKGIAQPDEQESTLAIYSTVSFKGNTILIVDDIADNRKLLSDVLEPTGARLYEAENGAQAVRMALALKPDIILMDIRMPVMDGLEACRILKNTPETAKIPCIAVSASIKLGKPGKEIPENFEDNLMKPVVFEHLFEMLLRYLKHAMPTDSGQSVETLTVSDEEQEWSEDLKYFAMNELVPLYHHVMRTQLVDEIEDFGKKLITAGHRFNEEMLINVGRKIGDYADQFEVDKLTQTMQQFQLILDHKLN